LWWLTAAPSFLRSLCLLRRFRRWTVAANFERLPQMFLAKRPCEAVSKLCGYDFGVFEAPSAFALGDAGNGEH
jgi:hypothetical protein